jgi:hypothetical protein
MTPIQILLVVISVVIVLIYFQRLRSRLLDRGVFFVLAILAIAMVMRPDWANDVAHYLGVGRGADLLTYLGISGLAVLWLGLYTRQRDLDVRLTELARRLTILQAEPKKKKRRSR